MTKLEKKKTLYINAIIGGNFPKQNMRDKFVEKGIIKKSKVYEWVKSEMMNEPMNSLKELYEVLNE